MVICTLRQVAHKADAGDFAKAIDNVAIGHHDADDAPAANYAEISLSLYKSSEPRMIAWAHGTENGRRPKAAF
jgi:hypothetical protein